MTHHCAVIGSPINHSLSPVIHRSAYLELGLSDWDYQAIEVRPDELHDFLTTRDSDWVGLSVTAPLKQELLKYGEAEHYASELHAANTLIFGSPARLYNTDVTGMQHALLAADAPTQLNTAIVMGAGATARSALAALSLLGAAHVTCVARDVTRARASLSPISESLHITVDISGWDSIASLPSDSADLLVSTIPMDYDTEQAEQLCAATHTIFDISYGITFPTTLNKVATAHGRRNLDGLDLLVHQAVDQVTLMTGMVPSVEPLMKAARAATR